MTEFDGRRGTRGARQPKGRLMVWGNTFMARRARKGKKPFGLNLLVLITTGRKSGLERTVPVGWFPDGQGNWLIVASANGATDNPAWYYNLAAAPDKARIEVDGTTIPVTAHQLHGAEREAAWSIVTTAAPSFGKYEAKTDREIPVLRLTPRVSDLARSRPSPPGVRGHAGPGPPRLFGCPRRPAASTMAAC
jgi:deazaflavin-dependent oxidoreductase (nitroreductase family)